MALDHHRSGHSGHASASSHEESSGSSSSSGGSPHDHHHHHRHHHAKWWHDRTRIPENAPVRTERTFKTSKGEPLGCRSSLFFLFFEKPGLRGSSSRGSEMQVLFSRWS
jgi:hypothetical protein